MPSERVSLACALRTASRSTSAEYRRRFRLTVSATAPMPRTRRPGRSSDCSNSAIPFCTVSRKLVLPFFIPLPLSQIKNGALPLMGVRRVLRPCRACRSGRVAGYGGPAAFLFNCCRRKRTVVRMYRCTGFYGIWLLLSRAAEHLCYLSRPGLDAKGHPQGWPLSRREVTMLALAELTAQALNQIALGRLFRPGNPRGQFGHGRGRLRVARFVGDVPQTGYLRLERGALPG